MVCARAIQGLQVRLNDDISKETGMNRVILPSPNVDYSTRYEKPEFKVNPSYVLTDKFLKEQELV